MFSGPCTTFTAQDNCLYCAMPFQVPQYILDAYLEAGHGAECCIAVTQVSHVLY